MTGLAIDSAGKRRVIPFLAFTIEFFLLQGLNVLAWMDTKLSHITFLGHIPNV